MSTLADLEEIVADLEAILRRTNGDGPVQDAQRLPFDDAARFKAHLIEAKSVLDEGLGRLNDFSSVVSAVHRKVVNYSEPTTADVAEGSQTLQGAMRRLRRLERVAGATSSSWVPAADRYVSISDNQRQELQSDLSSLREVVRGDNFIDAEEKELLLYEIAVFEQTLAAPRVSLELVERFANGALAWITKTAINAAASEIAKRIMLALACL